MGRVLPLIGTGEDRTLGRVDRSFLEGIGPSLEGWTEPPYIVGRPGGPDPYAY